MNELLSKKIISNSNNLTYLTSRNGEIFYN